MQEHIQEQLDIVWRETLNVLRGTLNTPTFKTWFENTRPLDLSTDTLVIAVPNPFAKEWLETRYSKILSDAVLNVMGHDIGVKIKVDPSAAAMPLGPSAETGSAIAPADPGEVASAPPAAARRSNGLDPHGAGALVAAPDVGVVLASPVADVTLNAKYTFERFVVGSTNRFAHAAALAVAESPALAYNPLFIYGGVGLGKTHLLQAIAHYIGEHHPRMKVKYVSSEKFTNDFINAIREKDKIAGFQKRYRNNDVLLIDDIQFLEGKEGTQEEFFHTFNTLYEANRQIVISSDRPPKDIATLEDRLRTRFECGLTTDIQPPDTETRIAILRTKSAGERLTVPDEVLELIASRIQSNIRELEGALIRVVAFSSLTQCEITIELAHDVLRDIFPEERVKPISISTIQSETCRYFNVTKIDLVGSKRSQAIAYPRQIAMYLSRELTDLSLPKIAEEFGGRDHTTVMYANNKILSLINTNRDVYNQVQELTNRIRQRG